MNQDQLKRLTKLSEKLADVALSDADPENWVGHGVLPMDLTAADRGDAVWCRKVALSTLSVLGRTVTLITQAAYLKAQTEMGRAPPGVKTGEERLLDDEVAAAEKEGKKLLRELLDREKPKEKHGNP
jgi:hypothetical protein